MRTETRNGAPGAPSPKILQTARIAEVGISPSLAVALADLFFPTTKRDDLTTLAAVTVSRCSAASAGVRS